MTLVVTGKHSLANLEKWVTEKFGPIVNKHVKLPSFALNSFRREDLGKLVRFKPVRGHDTISFEWILDFYDAKQQVLKYFEHILSNGSENSLLSYLISEGLAIGIDCFQDTILNSFQKLTIEISVTSKGIAKYEQVIETTFKYLILIRNAGVQDYIIDELNEIGEMKFAHIEKSKPTDYCIELSKLLGANKEEDIQYTIQ